MQLFQRPVQAASVILVTLGILLLGLNLAVGGTLNVALPLVFLILGGVFMLLAGRRQWPLVSLLYLPGALMLALGLVFLLNILTNDWNAWSYAWLLVLASLGAGLVLASAPHAWHPAVRLTGWGLALGGITFFAIFGAIVGGLFIQVSAPILLILAGLALRWGRVQQYLPQSIARRLVRPVEPGGELPQLALGTPLASPPPVSPPLAEPLSARELEVLQLVDAGLSNQQIAQRLNVAPSTVKTHINNIYGKLGVQTRVQALRRSRELGLL